MRGVFFFFFPPLFSLSVGSPRRGVEDRDEGVEDVVPLRTALNGRPRAGVDWCFFVCILLTFVIELSNHDFFSTAS